MVYKVLTYVYFCVMNDLQPCRYSNRCSLLAVVLMLSLLWLHIITHSFLHPILLLSLCIKPRCFWDSGMIMKPSCHVRISFRTEMEKNSRELFQNKFDIPQIVLCWADFILLDSEKLSALSFIEKSKKKCRVWWSMISFCCCYTSHSFCWSFIHARKHVENYLPNSFIHYIFSRRTKIIQKRIMIMGTLCGVLLGDGFSYAKQNII